MALPDHIEELLKRLNKLKPVPTNPYGRALGQTVNPDGPEAAAVIREQAERVGRLEAALKRAQTLFREAYQNGDIATIEADLIAWLDDCAALTPEQEPDHV